MIRDVNDYYVVSFSLTHISKISNYSLIKNDVLFFSVAVKPLSVKILSSNNPLSADREITLSCQSVGSTPPAVITWWKDNKQLHNATEKVSILKLISISGWNVCLFSYTLSEAWSGVNWADLMAAQSSFGTDFDDRSTRTIVGTMLWTEYRHVIQTGTKGALGSHEIRPIHSVPSLGQSIHMETKQKHRNTYTPCEPLEV